MTLKRIDFPFRGNVIAFSTLRGVEPDRVAEPYAGFNACHYTGDSVEHISECRAALCDELAISRASLVIPRQTHSLNVAVIDHYPDEGETIDNVDALVTALPGVALAINTADCVPLLMADTEAGVVAAVHSGWRGTVGRIAARAVDAMVALGANLDHINAYMGPHICEDCFEVGPEVAERFEAEFAGGDTVNYSFAKPHVNLARAIQLTLADSGLSGGNVHFHSSLCSHCHPHRFFSARRLGINSGRTLSVIVGGRRR